MKFLRILAILCLSTLTSTAQTSEKSSVPEYQFKGSHFLASYCDCDETALTDLKQLKIAFINAAKASRATILDSVDYEFQATKGLTMVILFSESHGSIHTYPEHRACFVDLFTCGDHCLPEPFDQALQAYLKPKAVSKKTLVRSDDIKEK
jgi:S-adenosylmethionine decarboxylase